ncbi:MAG: hypothetical protein ACYDDC_07735 [Thermoplasmataceae archaeon]
MLKVLVRKGTEKPKIDGDRVIIFTNVEREKGLANVDVIKQIKFLYKSESVKILRGKHSSHKIILVEDKIP